jgi:hypothetical protein
MHESNRRLQTSRSFSHLPTSSSKITRMFGRKTLHTATSLSSLFPHKTITGNIKIKSSHSLQGDIMSTIIASASAAEEPWIQLNQEPLPPPPPIENDPHVFDLLSKDSAHYIHYGKCDATVTSATVEKLIEKLTREMGMFVCSAF